MNHVSWAARMKEIIDLHRQGRSDAALKALERLVRVSKAEARTSVSHWHVEQASGLRSVLLEESGRPAEAARLLIKHAKVHNGELNYHASGKLNALAAAVLCYAKAGNKRRVSSLGRQVLKLAADIGETNPVVDAVARELKKLGDGA
jgi:hypothetical protein